MARKRELEAKIEDLREQLERKATEVTKYVAVTNLSGEVEVEHRSRYGGYASSTIQDGQYTVVLVRRNEQPDTITLKGKWSIAQIKEAANG